MGELKEVTESKNNNSGCHSFSEEKAILRWLHDNKKIDATLCMLKDTKEFILEHDVHKAQSSKFILNLLNME